MMGVDPKRMMVLLLPNESRRSFFRDKNIFKRTLSSEKPQGGRDTTLSAASSRCASIHGGFEVDSV